MDMTQLLTQKIHPDIGPETAGTFIDLFCGCGGFTLGMMRAGFRCLAAIDFNKHAVETLRANLANIPNVLQRDLTAYPPENLAELIGTNHVDVIVGGPPCQGFSTARQCDGANHGARLKEDPRRLLYREFLKYIGFFMPRVFVMENVLGIKSAAGGKYFTRVQAEARDLGYRVHGQVEDAWALGVPQKRRRQLIIGTRIDMPNYFLPVLQPAPRAVPYTTLGAAICDLPRLRAGSGLDECDYDLMVRTEYLRRNNEMVRNYLINVLEIEKASKLTNHVSRPHNDRDLRDFAKLREGESSAVAMRDHGVEFEFPYDKSSFKDRYTRQGRSKPCSTIVAHLSKDGLMFIHPTQNRSITPREAARIQSFPDWFRFPEARTNSFRLIGNAVPPLVAEAVGLGVSTYLNNGANVNKTSNLTCSIPIPMNMDEAIQWLLPLLDLDTHALRHIENERFSRGWAAISFLYPGLHPDGGLERGNVSHDIDENNCLGNVDPRLQGPYYEISGWPVVLVPVAEEAWRRFENKIFKYDDLYRCDAQREGMRYRNPELFVGEGSCKMDILSVN
ncbi:MAG: DNA cytosine methyltransferase [Candidatus Brocadiia bacterium]|nr:MAG: DNA cytosine methyltransferase [Candidatus Brocadiia bacterium]